MKIKLEAFVCELQLQLQPMVDIRGEAGGHERYVQFRNMLAN